MSTDFRSRRVVRLTAIAIGLFLSLAVLPGSLTDSYPIDASAEPARDAEAAPGGHRAAHPVSAAAYRASTGLFAPAITATKVDSLFTDVDGDGKADPGDTLKYTVTITNAGSDALGLNFSDTIDANTTLVPGSVNTSPIAFADNYSAIGNVSISPNAAQGLLANDFDADGHTLAITGNTAPSCGGNLAVNPDGSFSFNPPAGFEGTCTFGYTVSDGQTPPLTDTGTVTITVNGMIWFVDNSLGVNGDGRLSSPFNSLPNFVSGAADDPGDNIFLFRQTATNYAGPLTLLNNQRLIGQGATASLSTITGLVPQPYSASLPATGGTNPVIAHNSTNLTLASGNTLRGLNLSNSGGTALTGNNFGNLSVSEASVSNANGIAINLNTGNPTVSFTSVSSSGGSNGIVLQNTTGSFTVTGTGGTCTEGTPTCTGGTISNTTGADNSTATPPGAGIVLNNVTNVSFTRMRVHDNSNYAVRGTNVNGFTFDNCVINGVNGTNVASPFNDSSMRFDGLFGTANLTNSSISGGFYRNIQIINTSGSLSLTVNNCNIHDTGATQGDDGILVENQSTANITANITNNTFSRHGGDHFNGSLLGSGTIAYTITGNTLTGGHAIGLGQGIFILGATFNGSLTYNVSNNGSIATPITGNKQGAAIFVNKGSGSGSFSGRIENNVIGNPAVVGSGSEQGAGIDVEAHGSGSHTTLINNNTIRQYNADGITIIGGEVTGALTFNATITNNTISNPDGIAGSSDHGIQLNIGTLPGDNLTACMDVRTNTLTNAGDEGQGGVDFRLRQRQSTTIRLPGYGGANNDNAAVQAFESGQNALTSILASNTVPTGGGFVGGAACALPASPGFEPLGAGVQEQKAGDDSEPKYTDYLFAPEPKLHSAAAAQGVWQADVISMVQAALALWKAKGVSEEDMARLAAVQFEIADLPDDQLSVTTPTRVLIDETASEFGWFIDPTPEDNSEFEGNALFRADSKSPAFGRIDLLTVVTRALGYVLDHEAPQHSSNRYLLRMRTLAPSVRRLPIRSAHRVVAAIAEPSATSWLPYDATTPEGSTIPALPAESTGLSAPRRSFSENATRTVDFGDYGAAGVRRSALKVAATSGLLDRRASYPVITRFNPMSGETVSRAIGTLPMGKSVTITFRVTIDTPFPLGDCEVSNQGTVSGSNFSNVLTDDPAVGGASDPTVTDLFIAPTITCPANITTNTDPGQCAATVTFSTTTTGCAPPTVTCTPASGSAFPKGTTTVNCTATNSEGSASCSFTVTVNDNEAPTLNCPANITTGTDPGQCSAVVNFTATSSDNCPGMTASCTPPSGSTFPKGTTTVTCTATDASGNTTNCSFTVTVDDTTPPSLSCPANIMVNNDPGQCAAVVNYATPTATDNCPGVGATTCAPPSGSTFSTGTTTVTCSATDAAGNTGSCSFTVMVNDGEGPTITCPASGGASAATNCLPPANSAYTGQFHALYAMGLVDLSNPIHYQFSACNPPPPATPGGTTTDTLTSQVQFDVTMGMSTVHHQAPATVTVRVDFNSQTGSTQVFDTEMLQLDISGGTLPPGVMIRESPTRASTGQTTITTAPGGFRIDSFFDVFTELSLDGGQTWHPSQDQNGNPFAGRMTAVQTTDPGQCSAVVNFPAPAVSDNCPGLGSPMCNPATGSTFPKGTTTVTCTVTDAMGNSASCSFTVTVADVEPPVLTPCPANITVNESSPGSGSAIVTYTDPTATDNCPGQTVACVPPSGSSFPVGTTTVTCTATDTSMNTTSCSFTVTVNPLCSITCPANIVRGNDAGQCGANVTYPPPTTMGSCGTVTCTPASGSFFPIGTTTVTCLTSVGPSCSFTITVNDTEAPSITCPANIVQSTDPNACTAVVNYAAPAVSDNCPGVGAPSCSPASGSTFPKGVTTVTCSVSDAAGNQATCSFTVTVNDTQAPTITCPADITQSTDSGVCTAVVTYAAPAASDNCPGLGTPTCNPPSGSTFPKGTTTVTCTVSDAMGNQSTCSFTVTVNDTESPTITCPASISVPTDPNQCSAVVNFTVTATDNCPGVTLAVNPPSGTAFPKGTTTVTAVATDTSGNSASCTFTVTVNDTQAPSIACPANITVPNDPGLCSAVVTYAVSATDNCPGVTLTVNPPSGSTFPKGTTTVTGTAVDASGNVSVCMFTVTVVDTEAPEITCPAAITVITPNPGDTCSVVNFAPAVTDNCPGATFACSPPSGSCFPLGTTTVTCTATDASGNTASCSFAVTTFDICMQDDSNSNVKLLINSLAGLYRMCCGGTSVSGRGLISRIGGDLTLQHNATDRRLLARYSMASFAGTASLQLPPGVTLCTIRESNSRNNTNCSLCR